jgi:Icc-related predicted phosphoesterase
MAKKDIVPVFGDIHGNLEGLVNTMEFIQREFSLFPDIVLQVGDMGYFPGEIPSTEKIRSDQELLFHNYLSDFDYSRRICDNASFSYQVVFVRGNHEDQESLKNLSINKPHGSYVDAQKRFWFIPDAQAVCIDNENYISLVGFGGIDSSTRPKAYKVERLIAFSEDKIEEIGNMSGIDILMTHQGPKDTVSGSDMIDVLIDLARPKIHLHGHSHREYSQTLFGDVRSYGLGKMPSINRPFLESNDFYGFLDTKSLDFSFGTPIPLY